MKALVLFSGGLDSLLAAAVLQRQGITVVPVYFHTPFSRAEKLQRIGAFARELGEVKLCVRELKEEFLDLIRRPSHGFGSQMNPCIDCKILMLRRTKELLSEEEASFVVTGEVLGQRPMSQNRQALALIEKESGLQGFLLRPLCAQLLEETIPEKNRWVRREELYAFSGRGRNQQFELAHRLGIREYAQPAGGCLLTEEGFSRRLRDLVDQDELTLERAQLLLVGRHFCLGPKVRLIVGRDERENDTLLSAVSRASFVFMPPADAAGPVGLGFGQFSETQEALAASIVARYCDHAAGSPVPVQMRRAETDPWQSRLCIPATEELLARIRI